MGGGGGEVKAWPPTDRCVCPALTAPTAHAIKGADRGVRGGAHVTRTINAKRMAHPRPLPFGCHGSTAACFPIDLSAPPSGGSRRGGISGPLAARRWAGVHDARPPPSRRRAAGARLLGYVQSGPSLCAGPMGRPLERPIGIDLLLTRCSERLWIIASAGHASLLQHNRGLSRIEARIYTWRDSGQTRTECKHRSRPFSCLNRTFTNEAVSLH